MSRLTEGQREKAASKKNCGHRRGQFCAFSKLAQGVPGRVVRFSELDPAREICLYFFNAACGEERRRRALVICVPSASRGRVDERAFHLLLNALNGPAT
jgi:hypothetical protein